MHVQLYICISNRLPLISSLKNVYIPRKADSTEICPIYNKTHLLCNNMLLLSSLQFFFPVFLRHLLPQLKYFIKILHKIHRRTTNWICLLILKNDRIYSSNFFPFLTREIYSLFLKCISNLISIVFFWEFKGVGVVIFWAPYRINLW